MSSLPFFAFRWFTYPPFAVDYWDPFTNKELPREVLGTPVVPTRLTGARHVLANSWEAPFFYADSRNVF